MTNSPSKKSRAWASLSYLGILIVFPLISKQNDSFVLYHSRQGIVLIFVEVILGIVSRIIETGFHFFSFVIISITLIYTIIGILNAVRGREISLPLIGKFSERVQV